jgi:hypothetical protein
MVPARVIDELRTLHALAAAHYFIAEDNDLSSGARQLSGNRTDRHLPMYANDMFVSLYFAFLRKRFRQAIETAEQQTLPERAFPRWTDSTWNRLLVRLRQLLDFEFPDLLDSAIGLPGSRPYDDGISTLPTRLSELRQMFLEGKVQHPGSYQPFRFDPIKDIVLLTLLAAFIDLGNTSGFSLRIADDIAGILLAERTGIVRTICFVYGTYPRAVFQMVNGYLSEVEDAFGSLPTFEVLIVPCSHYNVATNPAFAPGISYKSLPGVYRAKRTFVNPDVVFDSSDFSDLVLSLSQLLGV